MNSFVVALITGVSAVAGGYAVTGGYAVAAAFVANPAHAQIVNPVIENVRPENPGSSVQTGPKLSTSDDPSALHAPDQRDDAAASPRLEPRSTTVLGMRPIVAVSVVSTIVLIGIILVALANHRWNGLR